MTDELARKAIMSDDAQKIQFSDEEVKPNEELAETDSDTSQTDTPSQQDDPGASQGVMDQETFIAVKGLIQRLSMNLDELNTKQKDLRQSLTNIADNDLALAEMEEQAKDAQLAYKKRKKDLMESTEAKEIRGKLKELNEEKRDLQDSLTNHLLNYFQMTGTQSFETPSGGEREFKLNARLLPPKQV